MKLHDVVTRSLILPSTVAAALLMACAPAPAASKVASPSPSPSSPVRTTSAETPSAGGAAGGCELVCEGTQIALQPAEPPDYHSRTVANADRVFEAMHDDLLACYKGRVAVDPKAHGFITVDIVLGPDGHVRSVETTGGALLGTRAMGCIVDRIKAATFEAVYGGGTRRIHVPFTLRRVGADETI